jgi:hypothetical protein
MQDEITVHGSIPFATILLIVVLTILDTFFTLELVSHGATEINPIMCYYLNHGPLVFFAVKYTVTSTSIFLVLAIKESYGRKTTVPLGTFLAFPVIALGLVVSWEVYLIYF